MKFLATIAILFTLSAGAELKLPGTFIPQRCGQDKPSEDRAYTVNRVCLGHVSYFKYPAIEVRFTAEGSNFLVVLKVVEQKPVNGGINPNYTATQLTLQDRWGRTSKARLEKLKADSAPSSMYLSGETPAGVRFHSEALEIMFTTM